MLRTSGSRTSKQHATKQGLKLPILVYCGKIRQRERGFSQPDRSALAGSRFLTKIDQSLTFHPE
jgi:hypothetical protein